MLTLQILLVFFIFGSFGSIMLLKEGYKRHAKFLFFDMTLNPILFILSLIMLIGIVPMH